MKNEHNCDLPLRAVETITTFFYCRTCGYTKTIFAEREIENLDEENDKEK